MLVDDDPIFLRSLTRNLEEMQFTVHTAICAAEAHVVLKLNPIDVVVCDYKMPGTIGLSFLEQIVAQNPNLATILLTGEVAELSMALSWAKKIGVHCVLSKPCCPNVLASEISAAAVAQPIGSVFHVPN
jgi:DNA-binding NtrC family response regulator